MPRLRAIRNLTWAQAAPWLAAFAWVAGAAGIWYLSGRFGWSPARYVAATLGWALAAAVAFRGTVRDLFGPVFAYETTRLGRKRLTFVVRLLYAMALSAMLAFFYLVWLEETRYNRTSDTVDAGSLARFANSFFVSFSVLQFVALGLLTPVYVASCVTDEKERRTIEFLLATDLKSHEIVFGKLAARVLTLLMFVLAGLPVMGFLQLFGGVDPDLLILSTAATVVTILGFSAACTYFSVTLRRSRDAIALSYVALGLYHAASFLIGFAVFVLMRAVPLGTFTVLGLPVNGVALMRWAEWLTDILTAGNLSFEVPRALLAGGFVAAAGTRALVDTLAHYALFWLIAGGLPFVYAFTQLRAVATRQAGGGPPSRGASRRVRKQERHAVARPAVGEDAMFWKEVYADAGVRGGCVGRVLMLLVLAMVVLPGLGVFGYCFADTIPPLAELLGLRTRDITLAARVKDFREGMSNWLRFSTGLVGFLALLSVAVRGAGSVSGERDRDTWISLAATPLSAWEMLRAKWLGAILGQRPLFGFLVGVWAVGLVCGAVEPLMLAVAFCYLLVYLAAFAWVGVYFSIVSRTSTISTIRTILVSLFVVGGHWVVQAFCCVVPLEVILRFTDSRGLAQGYFETMLGLTPPFMLGWLALPPNAADRRYEVFLNEQGHGVGLAGPLVGLAVWLGVTFFVGRLSLRAFARLANRVPRRPRAAPRARPVLRDRAGD